MAGLALIFIYLFRTDADCASAPSRLESACYSVKVLDIFPIARAELFKSEALREGQASLEMKLTPVGLAASMTKGNRFELFSSFKADDGTPEEFAIALYDINGPRYVKTSRYDFGNKTIRWEKSYPTSRNKKNFAKEYNLASSALSPLGAFYLMTRKPSEGGQELKIQVQDIPYIARSIDSVREGGAVVSTYAIGKDKGRVEPWRRRLDMELDLFFSCTPVAGDAHGCLPHRIVLPFRLITFTAAGTGTEAAR